MLNRNSREPVSVECDSKSSQACQGTETRENVLVSKTKLKNSGNFFCVQCYNSSIPIKTKETHDTQEKFYYFLGWIFNRSYFGEENKNILFNAKIASYHDFLIIQRIFSYLQEKFKEGDKTVEIPPDSKVFPLVCSFLKTDSLPDFPSEDMTWAFIRGVFDSSSTKTKDSSISFCCNKKLVSFISNFIGIKNEPFDGGITFFGSNCLDFLSKLYDTADCGLTSGKNVEQYRNFAKYDKYPTCKYMKLDQDAIPPSKAFCSDEGMDMWLIKVDKKISDNVIRYDTGICVEPDIGWHTEIYPRSSLSNTGWMLSNSIGLIDSSYRGSIKVCLTRVDPKAPDITLPFKGVQILMKRNNHFVMEEVREVTDTSRGSGGFGSTNKDSVQIKK